MNLAYLTNEDYQRRGGRYPRANVPDRIEGGEGWLAFSFKNTDEATAKQWAERFLRDKGLQALRLEVNQTGDYQDDWVDVFAEIQGA